jgi:hypothetical protein
MARAARRSKYGNVRTTIDGYTFASKREARAYQDLKLREKAGEVRDVELQPRFDLAVNGVKICVYVGDFRFRELSHLGDGMTHPRWDRVVVADSKGARTRVYEMKRKLMKAIHGIEIREL